MLFKDSKARFRRSEAFCNILPLALSSFDLEKLFLQSLGVLPDRQKEFTRTDSPFRIDAKMKP